MIGLVYDGTNFQLQTNAAAVSGSTGVDMATLRQRLLFYPEILSNGGLFQFTTSTGQIVINAGQSWLHRGIYLDSTDNYASGARTFSTAANKTYHLRWEYNGGAPAFTLKDLSNGVYNPSSLAETDSSFDSNYDDMLMALVVTNGSNALTGPALKNKDRLMLTGTDATSSFGVGSSGAVSPT